MIIVTSLSPKHSNSVNQHAAIASWKQFGECFSLNHVSEIDSLQGEGYDIEIIETDQTIQHIFGKPLVTVSALIEFAKKREEDLFVINSDIFVKSLPELKDDGLTIFSRFDYKEDMEQNSIFPHGFDGFYIPFKFLFIFPPTLFALGSCFHDYWWPFVFMYQKLPVYYPEGKYLFHKLHDAPNVTLWEKMGQLFAWEFGYDRSLTISQVNTHSLGKIRSYISGEEMPSTDPKYVPRPKTIDIFIKTYKPDFWLLQIALKTIAANVSGYNRIILLIPEADKLDFDTRNMPPRTDIHYVNEYGKGYLYQQVCKLQAYKYSSADYIMMSDSDAFFDHAVDVQDLIKDGKTEILYTDYEQIPEAKIWKACTEKFLGETVDFEFMRRLQLTYRWDTLAKIAEENADLEERIMKSDRFSEFNFIGAWAFKNERDKYNFINTDNWKFVPPMATQCWSHANPNGSEDHKKEWVKILQTILKSFGVNMQGNSNIESLESICRTIGFQLPDEKRN